MTTRLVVVIVVAATAVLAIGVGWLIGLGSRPGNVPEPIPTHAAPDELAAQACEYTTATLPQQVADDVAADDVRAGLTRARSLAQTAADRDASWVALASGIATLQQAVESDDAGATDLALRVVEAECP